MWRILSTQNVRPVRIADTVYRMSYSCLPPLIGPYRSAASAWRLASFTSAIQMVMSPSAGCLRFACIIFLKISLMYSVMFFLSGFRVRSCFLLGVFCNCFLNHAADKFTSGAHIVTGADIALVGRFDLSQKLIWESDQDLAGQFFFSFIRCLLRHSCTHFRFGLASLEV